MQDRQIINDSYYCGRLRQDETISVFTTNSYVVAEYAERTGVIKWYRVVNASHKESIASWLGKHFPLRAPEVVVAVKKTGRKAQAALA